MWVAVVSLLPTGAVDWPSRRPRALWSGSADQAARLSETAVAFARLCLCGVETAVAFARSCSCGIETVIAFAGAKCVFLAHFSGAEVSSVSVVPCWGRAVVMVVSMVAVQGRAVVLSVSKSPWAGSRARKSSPCLV